MMIGLLLSWLVLAGAAFYWTAWAFVFAGRVSRIQVTFKRGLLISAMCFVLHLAVVLARVCIPLEPMTILLDVVGLLGMVVIVKQLLGLRVRKACLVALLGSVFATLVGLMVILPIRLTVATPFKIPSLSKAMLPVLAPDDRLLVNKMAYWRHAPQRWDVAVFRFPGEPSRPFIKRVIGLPGETIEIREGRILINGASVTPPGSVRARWLNQGQFAQPGQPFQIPPGCYFVLGDDGALSHDSRFWGCVPRANFIGKAWVIYWPTGRMGEVR